MPRNRNKRIFSACVSLLFAMSVAYFAVLPPTSAWFYVNLYDDGNTFIFGTLEIPSDYLGAATIDLPAATRLDDPNETLFDEALHIVEVQAENSGTLPARVYLIVAEDIENSPGLHYFFYEDNDTGDTVKEKIAQKGIETYAELDVYNNGTGDEDDYGHYIVFQPGEEKAIKIAFWADYNEVDVGLYGGVIKEHANYDLDITLRAGQDTDDWFIRA